MNTAGFVPGFLRVGARPLVVPTAPPATSSGIGTGGAIAIGVGVVALGLLGLYAFARRPGWYVELYNYPVGNPDRRLKGHKGPYPTREDAVAFARTQTSVWYPKVTYSDVAPA